MNNGTAFLPKLLIWDTVSGFTNSKVKTSYSNITPQAPDERYNLPWWIDATILGSAYNDLWYIENPRNQSFIGFDVDAEFVFDCDTYNNFDIDGLFTVSRGNSSTLTVEINHATGIMKITGEI